MYYIMEAEIRIVASTASMLEEPTRKKEEPIWIQFRTFTSNSLDKSSLLEAVSASMRPPQPQ